MQNVLIDRYGRVHDYLRISVTDRCNLRCVYCMPEEGMEFEPDDHLLTFNEITTVVRVLARLGVRKLRLTGGEPLVRKHIEDLVNRLSSIPGIEDIALTTNGMFLAPKAEQLKAAGLTRINISLDSLKEDRFAFITRGGKLKKVLEGLNASAKVGFNPIKLNVVLMKGINDDEIVDFIELSRDHPIQVRFIEYMPIGHDDQEWRGRYVSLARVMEECPKQGWEVQEVKGIVGNGPSQNFRIHGAAGTFGLIHPVSDHFCESCNRLRLTADGNIKPCLYWSDEFNVRPYIGDEKAIMDLFFRALDLKPQSHEMAQALLGEKQSHQPTLRRMSQIGG
ncbi:molybdenum cofactor biosynthesis protein A [Paenibacillus larvae subsp. larvae]|uniref:GTP 3',8-cyclase n=1 Tax=Paenibacillus larvae subsp. larvae TaxID=147375 RepID=A0A2L1U560_9BACL|nr:GTP 3',8-cyclase MoaA [Paenibacillus larvae]AQT84356.1 cyclic pyranopterin phosphate synthase [Paenibacillus larvae subsp. pulvifaciens]AVF28028.1 molybdenum cofactor biosynthesis protein A [Paenibacillus larvae subsp. larvae]AVF32531.1 molybdenum cofactor biosynthesis protein A [Paenibacillus larvae subsp. larvae]MBH0344099.1 molybdenum cofactor biosynthesis protein MoeA [Paenibacillus larvae]MCY7519097.1 GTP 3',8-cyclase MoaA [Paenibacillus larvae]